MFWTLHSNPGCQMGFTEATRVLLQARADVNLGCCSGTSGKSQVFLRGFKAKLP